MTNSNSNSSGDLKMEVAHKEATATGTGEFGGLVYQLEDAISYEQAEHDMVGSCPFPALTADCLGRAQDVPWCYFLDVHHRHDDCGFVCRWLQLTPDHGGIRPRARGQPYRAARYVATLRKARQETDPVPAFQKKFGHFVSESAGYQVPASWQSGLAQAANMGSMVGIFIAAPCADRWGYKKTTLGGLVAMNALIFIMFFGELVGRSACRVVVGSPARSGQQPGSLTPLTAESLPVLLAGQFLCALPWGAFVACAPAYASEVAPLRLRNILTLYIQFCWTAGQFVSRI